MISINIKFSLKTKKFNTHILNGHTSFIFPNICNKFYISIKINYIEYVLEKCSITKGH